MKDEVRHCPISSFILHPSSLFVLVLITVAAGCAPDQRTARITEGYAALEARQYDEAMSRADAFLNEYPAGPGTAEAHYLRGRGIEQRIKANPQAGRADLLAAREAYAEALRHNPSPRLEPIIRASLANVAYFLDDYPTALREWSAAFDRIEGPDNQAWILYRVGLSQQRLGRFAEADKVFTSVEQRFPGTLQAQRAREKRGARGFSVQFATFLNSATADNAISTLRSQGVLAARQTDARSRNVIMAGPYPTYQQAQTVRSAHLDKYPDAIILP